MAKESTTDMHGIYKLIEIHFFICFSMLGLKLWFRSCFIIFICLYKLLLENKARARERRFSLWLLHTAKYKSEPSATILSSFMEFFLVLTVWCLHQLSERISKHIIHIQPLTRTRKLYFKLIQWPTSMMKKNFLSERKEFTFKINSNKSRIKRKKVWNSSK